MTCTMVQIGRDPFARQSTMRVVITDAQDCAWCGQPARFRYFTEPDERPVRPPTSGPAFCSVGCWRDYWR